MFGDLIKDATALMGGGKAAIDLLKALSGLFQSGKDSKGASDEARRLTLELKERLLDMQEKHAAIRERLLELEEAAKRREEFAVNRERYVFQETHPRSYAFVSKEGQHGAAPTHYLCAHCFEREQRSLLQLKLREMGADRMGCPTCGSETFVSNDIEAYNYETRPERGLW